MSTFPRAVEWTRTSASDMRHSLRARILVITVVPLVLLAIAALATVNHSVSRQVHAGIREELARASAVFENLLASRARTLALSGAAVAQDPRFFSVLTLPGGSPEAQVQARATVAGVARDFNSIAGADLFEVFDAHGGLVASVGEVASDPAARAAFLRATEEGRELSGILVEPDGHLQVTARPVVAGGQLVGTLLLGMRVGRSLAFELKSLTHSEVTFLSRSLTTGTTLEDDDDLAATIAALQGATTRKDGRGSREVFEVRGPRHTWVTLERTLPGAGSADGQRYVMQRSLDDETAFLRAMQVGLVALGSALLLAALLVGWLISNRITAPVRQLVRGAEEMERGNYAFPLGHGGSDEIGFLTRSFDQMRRRQQAYVTHLEEVTRLKSEFISVASHELRTPVSILKGYQELMAAGGLGPLTPAQEKALGAMEQSVGALARLAEDATRMAQIENDSLVLHPTPHHPDELVRDVIVRTVAAAGNRRVEVTHVAAAPLPRVRIDAPKVGTALGHLVANAVRFTPDGGHVRVHAAWADDTLRIMVDDEGVGIAPDDQPRVFDRGMLRDALHHHSSTTFEFNSKGLGLGLAIARGIARAHGGDIELTSAPGQGSTFVLLVHAEPAETLEDAA